MFDILPNFISAALGVALPLYLSHRAQTARTANSPYPALDPNLLQAFLLYFSVLALLLTFENLFLWITYLIPFYAWIRMFFILYLALPQTQGAKFVYNRYVAPFFGEYGLEIEGLIKRGHDVGRQAGLGSHGGGRNAQTGSLGMLGNVGIMAGGMLGTIAPAWFGGNQNVHSASPAADRTAPVSYADTLLSRFRIPSADGLAYGKAYDIPDPASLIPGSGKSASKGPVPSGIAGDSSRSEAKGSPLGTGYTSYINDGFAQATSILGAARGISKKEHSGAVSTGSERERAAETSGYGDRRRVVSGGSYRSDRLDDSDLDSASEEDVRRRSGGAGKQTGDRRRRSDYRD